MAVVEHVVEAEVVPRAVGHQRIDLDLVRHARPQPDQARDDQVAEGRVVVVLAALLNCRRPLRSIVRQIHSPVSGLRFSSIHGTTRAVVELQVVRLRVDLQQIEVVLLRRSPSRLWLFSRFAMAVSVTAVAYGQLGPFHWHSWP